MVIAVAFVVCYILSKRVCGNEILLFKIQVEKFN